MLSRCRVLSAFPILLLALTSTRVGIAASFSFTGTFQKDDNVALYTFNLSAPSTVTLETWSYGGGTDVAGAAIRGGGFYTALSLFNGAGSLVDYSVPGTCPPGNVDPVSAQCGDGFLKETLSSSGTYVVALTEYLNFPNGLTLSDGFVESGMGNYSGPLCGVSGPFFDPFVCDQRTGNYELDIVGVTRASSVPEPAVIWTTGSALLGCLLMAAFRKLGPNHKSL
jgi:hypothetical protein